MGIFNIRQFFIVILLWFSGLHASDELIKQTSMPTYVYIVRHGQTDWNVMNLMQGWTDIPLNNKGKAQAEVLSKKLKSIDFDVVFSSDLQRANETAKIVAFGRDLEVKIDPRLRGRTFGSWEGHLWTDFIAALPEEKQDVELDESVNARVFEFLQDIAIAYPESNLLVVSHGGVVEPIVIRLLCLECTVEEIEVDNTAMIKLIYHNGEWTIRHMEGIRFPYELAVGQ